MRIRELKLEAIKSNMISRLQVMSYEDLIKLACKEILNEITRKHARAILRPILDALPHETTLHREEVENLYLKLNQVYYCIEEINSNIKGELQ